MNDLLRVMLRHEVKIGNLKNAFYMISTFE
jgi:hypothetical protein